MPVDTCVVAFITAHSESIVIIDYKSQIRRRRERERADVMTET